MKPLLCSPQRRKRRRTLSIIDFVHSLVGDYTKYVHQSSNSEQEYESSMPSSRTSIGSSSPLKARLTRNVIEKFNHGELKLLRLSPMDTHRAVKGRKAYFVLCSWSRPEKPKGSGSNQR